MQTILFNTIAYDTLSYWGKIAPMISPVGNFEVFRLNMILYKMYQFLIS